MLMLTKEEGAEDPGHCQAN